MKLIELKATKEIIDIKTNSITYNTEVDAGPGILLLADKTGEKDLMITNQVHEGGPVVLKMKPTRMPAKKYSVGEVVAILMVNG
jgi:hypothetical protein